jgi:hypothetical protein
MTDSAEIVFALLLTCIAISQCGTYARVGRIADEMERRAPVADAGVP